MNDSKPENIGVGNQACALWRRHCQGPGGPGLHGVHPPPWPGFELSWGGMGGASPQVQAARKQAVEAQSRISGKQRVPLPTPTISLLSEP